MRELRTVVGRNHSRARPAWSCIRTALSARQLPRGIHHTAPASKRMGMTPSQYFLSQSSLRPCVAFKSKHTHTHTRTLTETLRHTHTDRHTHTLSQTHRHTQMHTHTHTLRHSQTHTHVTLLQKHLTVAMKTSPGHVPLLARTTPGDGPPRLHPQRRAWALPTPRSCPW